ncbi:Phosphatidylinositol glycan anchor biosynthesis class U protein [Golovinomyces cichoracearum]|uniref:Phosphatidylinositol glycan anchor biosynthesis class U protein n=1 Tax=Golovinomyces cichoracearum TaxID=62708 RepID=A0A420IIM4_9PEZI|nr:Phosphatidylinositol glycan anchor biosynthesis class U protein [Golovinomyces cichoracearum]
MLIHRRKATLLAAAAAFRLILFTSFPGLPDLLTARVEISTPVTSFKRLQEGLFLYQHHVSPYDGGVYHQAPLLLPLLTLLPDYSKYPTFTHLLYILTDLLSANALILIAASGEATSSKLYTSPRKAKAWSSLVIAAAFLFNPFTIATCLGRSSSIFTTCAILCAIAKAVVGASYSSMFALSIAAYLSMYPILLFLPLALLCFDRQPSYDNNKSLTGFLLGNAAALMGSLYIFLHMSFITTGSWEYLRSTYGVQLLLPDLTPNVGLWWYFFIEMFDSFRNFFLGVFWIHLSSYVIGLTIRLRLQPLFALTVLLGIFTIFKPYPSISDTSLFFAMLCLYAHVLPLMRYTFLALSTILYASFLGPAFYYLWIYAGSGNANFFYAITLVWSLGISILTADALFAVLRDELEVERPEMKGKAVRQI